MDTLIAVVRTTLAMYIDAAPWLLIGFVAAGLARALLPSGLLGRWLGGPGVGAIVKAALLGAPLPLCSCGVLPAAVELRRAGAAKGAAVSFLIATPETGPDSVAVSYALLGPFMAVVRPVAAVFGAVLAGVLTAVATRGEKDEAETPSPGTATACHGGSCATPRGAEQRSRRARVGMGLRYAFADILDDIALWLVVGFAAAGAMTALVPPLALADYGSGLGAMAVMLAVGVPLYMCATASTPIAAGLMAAGVSPGAALVFLLAGPATNLATLGVVGKNLGPRALAAYLAGIALGALAMGFLTDVVVRWFAIDVMVQMNAAAETMPESLKWAAGATLAPFLARSVIRDAAKRFAR